MKRPLVSLLIFAVLACAAWMLLAKGAGASGPATVTVERGTVVRKAVATGQVEPIQESQVNTHLQGFVRRRHAALGQKVAAGDPLCEVWPALTERELLAAERSLQAAIEGEETAQEFVAGDHLLAQMSRMLQGERNLQRMQSAAQRGRRAAEESLRLLREGSVVIEGRTIDFVLRAPVAGHVLQLAREGDPVTPASSFGTGTVVAVVGDLDQPVFRGTVDEIDVGRLREGMNARVTLGAWPSAELRGTVVEIGLRARRVDNAATFDVRVAVQPSPDVLLRAGYSAVAEVELARVEDVPVLPEHAVTWVGGRAHVWRTRGDGEPKRVPVELGLSDGLTIEVRSGLAVGDVVLERAPSR